MPSGLLPDLLCFQKKDKSICFIHSKRLFPPIDFSSTQIVETGRLVICASSVIFLAAKLEIIVIQAGGLSMRIKRSAESNVKTLHHVFKALISGCCIYSSNNTRFKSTEIRLFDLVS